MHFTTKDLRLSLSKNENTIELNSTVFPGAALIGQFDVSCQIEGKTIHLLAHRESNQEITQETIIETQFGRLRAARIIVNVEHLGLEVIVHAGVSDHDAMAFIQMELVNHSKNPVTINCLTPLIIKPGNLRFGKDNPSNPAFYSNGWQSWSHTATYGNGDQQNRSILGPFQNPMVVNPGTPTTKGSHHFTGDMFGILGDRTSRVGLLTGFLSQNAHFGSLEARFTPKPSLTMWANGDNTSLMPDDNIQTDWAVVGFIDLDAEEPMNAYLKAVARAHQIKSKSPVPVGWCSWYHFYENITEEDIEANLNSVIALKPDLPLDLLQIDDGFETYPGDWYDFDPGFPRGLEPLVKKINTAGLTPGLWLAPFIVHPKARLVKEHPDWLLRNAKGKPVNAGFVWNAFNYALDLTNPDALEYTCEIIRTAVKQWGFTYLKLDFLYAAALDGVYQNPTMTRAQVLRHGLSALRLAAGPDVTMLACGCPLGSALGLFEAMRISADVSGHWNPHFPPISPLLKNEPHMPAARNALQNIVTRAPLHRHWWINDPDCLLIRPDTALTLDEVKTLATAIGMTGGSLLLSDDLPALPKDRLQIAQALLPVIDQRAQVIDWFDNSTPKRLRVDLKGPTGIWHLLAQINWEDNPVNFDFSAQDYKLPQDQTWWLREFWTGEIGQMKPEAPYRFLNVPPHGVRLIAARTFLPDEPAYLGSDLHLSQGLEISDWQVGDKKLSLQVALSRKASGSLFFYLPWQPKTVQGISTPQPFQNIRPHIYSVYLEHADEHRLDISA